MNLKICPTVRWLFISKYCRWKNWMFCELWLSLRKSHGPPVLGSIGNLGPICIRTLAAPEDSTRNVRFCGTQFRNAWGFGITNTCGCICLKKKKPRYWYHLIPTSSQTWQLSTRPIAISLHLNRGMLELSGCRVRLDSFWSCAVANAVPGTPNSTKWYCTKDHMFPY